MAVEAHGGHSTHGDHGDLSEHAGDPHTGEHGDHPSAAVYVTIFVILMVLLAAAIVAGLAIGGTTGTILGFIIGIAKALLIIMYFMHVRYGTRLTWIFAGASFLWLGILLVLTMNDYVTRDFSAKRADPLPNVPIVTAEKRQAIIDRP
jgi:cytochrome c oxidase subunit 4